MTLTFVLCDSLHVFHSLPSCGCAQCKGQLCCSRGERDWVHLQPNLNILRASSCAPRSTGQDHSCNQLTLRCNEHALKQCGNSVQKVYMCTCVCVLILPQSVYPPIHSAMYKLFLEQESDRVQLTAAHLAEQVSTRCVIHCHLHISWTCSLSLSTCI